MRAKGGSGPGRGDAKAVLGAALTAILLVGGAHLFLSGRAPQPVPGVVLPVPGTAPVENEELAYIDRVVRALSAWDKEQLKPLLAPETLAGSSDAQLDQVLGTLGARLGALRSYAPPTPQPHEQLPGEPANLSAYRLVAQYDRGAADLSLVLRQAGGVRHLYLFNVEVAPAP